MKSRRNAIGFAAGLVLFWQALNAYAQTSPVTYQGRLNMSGQPYNGAADFQIALFDSQSNGVQVGAAIDVANVSVAEGLFAIELPFADSIFQDGQDRWLEIAVQAPTGSGGYITLSPRQHVTHTPYAMHTRGLSVDEFGQLGIGTGTPGSKIHAACDAGSQVGVFAGDLQPFGYTAFESNLSLPSTHAWFAEDGERVFSVMAGGNGYFAGNLGIGTTEPGAKLHIAGTAGVDGLMFPDGTLQTTAATTDAPQPWNANGADIYYDAGNVGIGTSSPAGKLHIAGDVKIDGSNTLEFGADIVGKESNAGKIGYQSFSPGLDIVGAGTLEVTRTITLWAEGGTYFTGGATFDGNVSMSGLSLTNGGQEGYVLTSNVNGDASWQPLPANAGGWGIAGNDGTNPATDFLGTTDHAALNFRVDNVPALRLEPTAETVNIIGGASENTSAANVAGATVFGGSATRPNSVDGSYGAVSGGDNNHASGYAATVGGGEDNLALDNFTVIAGGERNLAYSEHDTVGGGYWNTTSDYGATVAGGSRNAATGTFAFVGGGRANIANGVLSVVGGGDTNVAEGAQACLVGGFANTIQGNAWYATIGGGSGNAVTGSLATIPGGGANEAAGTYSFAAGNSSHAMHDGAFVWSDSQGGFASTGNDQFLIRAGGGVGINSNNPAGFGLKVGGSISCTSLTQTSDARLKTNVAPISGALETILSLQGVTFDWNGDACQDENFPKGRQVGFIAQELEKVLPELVTTDTSGYKSVAYSNVVPVLVEAVKDQQRQAELRQTQLAMEVTGLRAENAELRARLDRLETAIARGRE